MDALDRSKKTDYVYKTTPQRELLLTLVEPVKPVYDRAPLYFVIPGGGWWIEERLGMLNYARVSVNALLEAGFTVVTTDYRVTPEGVFLGDIITDCFDALRYVVHHAEAWGIDRHRIFVSGHSAGGHLALMIGMSRGDAFRTPDSYDEPYTVRGIAPMSPVTDLTDEDALRAHHEELFGTDQPEERQRVSPLFYATSHTPDTLLCAGTSDYHVLPRNSEKLHAALTEAGACSRLLYSIAGGHGFEEMHPGVTPCPTMTGVQEAITQFVLERL